jgi:hypothetical protein
MCGHRAKRDRCPFQAPKSPGAPSVRVLADGWEVNPLPLNQTKRPAGKTLMRCAPSRSLKPSMGMFTYYVDRLRGADNWPQTDATIVSCIWIDNSRSREGPPGWYEVTFSYKVSNEYYGGDFTLAGAANSESPYRRDDAIVVAYDPRRPERSYPKGVGETKAKAFSASSNFGDSICIVLTLHRSRRKSVSGRTLTIGCLTSDVLHRLTWNQSLLVQSPSRLKTWTTPPS